MIKLHGNSKARIKILNRKDELHEWLDNGISLTKCAERIGVGRQAINTYLGKQNFQANIAYKDYYKAPVQWQLAMSCMKL